MQEGFTENYILSALYAYSKNGVILILLATHVDDVIWANEPEAEGIMDSIKKELQFGKLQSHSFRFCGIEIEQSPDDFSIKVTCEQTTLKLKPIDLTGRCKNLEGECTPDERSQLWSIVGSLMWISRSCRPGISYRVSSLQAACRKPLIRDIVLANQVVNVCLANPKAGLTYRPGLCWPSKPEHEVQLCIAAVSDASHGSEEVYLDDWEEREAFRSQGAKMLFLTTTDILTQTKAQVHLVSFSSTVQPRVVNSTIKAEGYQLSAVVECADLLRAAIADAHGKLDHNDWETSAAAFMKCVWHTDCKSVYDTLQKPIAKSVDKRLGIELASLRQYLWRASGSHLPDRRTLEDRPADPSDILRWIDTLVMVVDCLTKAMREDFMMEVLDSNWWDFTQTEVAKAIKARKSELRSLSKQRKAAAPLECVTSGPE